MIIERYANPVNITISPTALQLRDLDQDRIGCVILALAIYFGAPSVVTIAVSQKIDPWSESSLFKCALYVATEMNNEQLVQRLLLETDKTDIGEISKDRKNIQARVILSSLSVAALHGNWVIAERLMNWSANGFAKPPFSLIGLLTEYAVASESEKTLITMCKLGYFQRHMKHYGEYIIKGLARSARPELILRFCVRESFLCEHDPLGNHTYLINLAVRYGSTRLAEAAFAVNAYGDYPAALRAAIGRSDVAMVRTLLDNGVDPEARMHTPVKETTCELSHNYEICKALREAIVNKMKALGPNYRPPHQILYTDKKVEGVLVAYTFYG